MDSIMERPKKAVCADCKHVARGDREDPRNWNCKINTYTTTDPVTGKVIRIFRAENACLRRNANGNCKKFEPTRLVRILRRVGVRDT